MTIDQLYFTRCASDKGREKIDGFQVKACSEGITGETEKRVRFFSQVYRWPTSLDPLVRPGPMAPKDFFKFPVSLHYYRVPDGRFGLTRICIAPIQPERAGNFFAHTLVFPPEALEPVSYNLFAVARSDIFQQQDESSQTELPELNDFSKLRVPEDKKCWNIATAMPYSEHLAPLVDVLSTGQSDRPVIILPSSLQDAWGLAEAVLLLLPGKFRIGIEFSVYEPNPYRIRSTGPEEQFYGQKLITTSPHEEAGKFQFRPEEYSAQYYVFNFAELHFSKFPTTSPYVQRVVADCRGGRLTEVFRLQSWLNRLKLDTDAEKWSSILDAIDYLDPSEHRPKPDMRVVIDALANICHSSEQAEAATPVLANLLAAEAGVCSENDLRAAFSSLGVLIDRTDKPERIKQDVSAKLSETVASMLFVGRAFCVQAASTTLGAAGQNILGKAVDHLLSKRSLAYETGSIQHAASPADMEALPEIMDQGLHALFEKPDRLRVKVLLPEALLFALKADCLGKLWVRLRPWLMSELLDTLPPTEAAELSRRIEAAVSGDKCPQAWLDLLRWQLCSTSVPKDVKTSIVTSLAAACRASSNPSIATKEALGEATKQLEGLNYLLLLEALVDKVDDEVSQIAEQAYNEFLVTIPEQDQWKLRRKMAGRNANLVNREFVRTVWPWSEEQGQETLDKWMHEIFERFPEVNNDVASKLTSLAVRAQDSDALTSLLSAYLRKATDGKIDRQGRGARAAIALALITVIPLDGMSPNLAQCLDNISLENWPPHEAVRFELMREMASVTQMYEAGRDLSFADLLKQRPLLLERIKSSYLESTERRQAFGWAVQVALKGPGIVDLESSEALLDITFEPFDKGDLEHIEEIQQTFVDLLSTSLNQVDLIKRVMALTQFALWAEKNYRTAESGTIWFIADILKKMNKETKNALWAYLEGRREDATWKEFLYGLRQAANGLTPPPQAKETSAEIKAPVGLKEMVPSVFDKLLGVARGLWAKPRVDIETAPTLPRHEKDIVNQPGRQVKKKKRGKHN